MRSLAGPRVTWIPRRFIYLFPLPLSRRPLGAGAPRLMDSPQDAALGRGRAPAARQLEWPARAPALPARQRSGAARKPGLCSSGAGGRRRECVLRAPAIGAPLPPGGFVRAALPLAVRWLYLATRARQDAAAPSRRYFQQIGSVGRALRSQWQLRLNCARIRAEICNEPMSTLELCAHSRLGAIAPTRDRHSNSHRRSSYRVLGSRFYLAFASRSIGRKRTNRRLKL